MDKIADTLRAPKPSTADNSAAEAVEIHSMADGRKYLDTGWNEETTKICKITVRKAKNMDAWGTLQHF
jgi:hypothetical protein